MDSLANHVRLLLKHAHDDPNQHQPEASYQSTFEGEGSRKTEFMVEELQRYERDGRYKIENCIAVSVGGADGSDLDALLTNTAIQTAFLIEYSDDGAQAARARAEAWKSKGKTLSVLQGDATMRKDDLIGKLKELSKQGYTTLVLVFLAVLHELPRRSTQKYDLRSFLGTLTDVLPNNVIFISEPCAPPNWPATVEIKIADLNSDLLQRWSLYIKRSLWDNVPHPDPLKIANGYVRMSKELAAEVLFKTIRRHDISRHLYEIGERLSSFDAEFAVRSIRDVLADVEVTRIIRASDGFMKAYRSSGVLVRTESGIACDPPDSHIKIIAHSVRSPLKAVTPPTASGNPTFAVKSSGGVATVKGISPPVLRIDTEYFLDLTDIQRIVFFREALRLMEAGIEPFFSVDIADVGKLRKRQAQLESVEQRTDAQRLVFLNVADNLKVLEERTRRFHLTIAAFCRGKFRLPLGATGTDGYYLQVAEIFERAIRMIRTGPAPTIEDCCDVIIHTSEFKNGPYITLRLKKSELSRADIAEAGTEFFRGPPEDYEGLIRNFSQQARLELLYPSVVYIFLRDGFIQDLPEEYESLERWQVSKG